MSEIILSLKTKLTMALSDITGWNPTTNPATPIENMSSTPGTSPAIQGITVPGTFTSGGKNYVAFVIDIFRGYKVTSVSIASDPNTISIIAQADASSLGSRISDYVESSVDFQRNNFTLNFDVTLGAESKKTYTFRKGGMGGGRPH